MGFDGPRLLPFETFPGIAGYRLRSRPKTSRLRSGHPDSPEINHGCRALLEKATRSSSRYVEHTIAILVRVYIRDKLRAHSITCRYDPIVKGNLSSAARHLMKTIVVSAVNITEGGPLSILRECLKSASLCLSDDFRIVAIVNSESLVEVERVETICIVSAKKSWFIRLYWEWIGFYRLSKKLRPYLWLSLHDITPRVLSTFQAVYCHNPSPFFRPTLQESLFSPTLFVWSHLYIYLYRAFIKRNHFIIVQQDWIRKAFWSRLGSLPIVVAYPSLLDVSIDHSLKAVANGSFRFFYPAFPRVFKNIQALCRAAQLLLDRGFKDFEIILTINGRENRYAKYLYSEYSHLPQIIFSGVKGPDEIKELYQSCDAVVFPSKLETWGLPITEAKLFAKPLLVADLPYARETVGDYSLVSFFPPDSYQFLSFLMEQMITKQWSPTGSRFTSVSSPFTSDWNSVWSLLIGKQFPRIAL